MNRNKKRITVRPFSIAAKDSFFDNFVSILNANIASEKCVRIIDIREKKHLIKIHDINQLKEKKMYFLSVVRERNTWQTRALSDGTISGIPLNQGIIGDPYFLLMVPSDKIILGFTTGPTGSLRSVASATLQQFNKERATKVALEHIPKKKELSMFGELGGDKKLRLKLDPALIGEIDEGTPGVIKELFLAPIIAMSSKMTLTLTDLEDDTLSELIYFLSEHDACSGLALQGLDHSGNIQSIDYSNAYEAFKAEVETRNKYIDEKKAFEVLLQAFSSFAKPTSVG
jgi:hypothetical protein